MNIARQNAADIYDRKGPEGLREALYSVDAGFTISLAELADAYSDLGTQGPNATILDLAQVILDARTEALKPTLRLFERLQAKY